MARLKINFQPLFLIYVFICIYFGWFNLIFYYIVTVILHEYGHYLTAKLLGYDLENISFNLFGAGLKTCNTYKPNHDIIISLAGPIVNLVIIVLLICLWWLFPTIYYFTYDFLWANITIMIFNLIPIYPLDGGRVLFALFSKNHKAKKMLIIINRCICFSLGILSLLLFIISIFTSINYTLLFIGFFLCVNAIINDNSVYYDKIKTYNKSCKSLMEVKTYRVQTLDKVKLIKYINPHYYTIFEYFDGNKIIKIPEEEILNLNNSDGIFNNNN